MDYKKLSTNTVPAILGVRYYGNPVFLFLIFAIFYVFSNSALAQLFTPKSNEPLIFEPRVITHSPSASVSEIAEESSSTPVKASYVNRLEEYQEQASTLIVQEGIYSANLIDNYLAIADIYEQDRQYQKSIDAYQSSLQLTRIEYGLDTELQIPILGALAVTYKHYGQTSRAANMLTKIFELEQNHNKGNIAKSLITSIEYASNLFELVKYAYHHGTVSPGTAQRILSVSNSHIKNGLSLLNADDKNQEQLRVALDELLTTVSLYKTKIAVKNLDHTLTTTTHDTRVNTYDPSASVHFNAIGIVTPSVSNRALAVGARMDKANDSDQPEKSPTNIAIDQLSKKIDPAEPGTDDPEKYIRARMDLADLYLLVGNSNAKTARKMYKDIYQWINNSGLEDAEALKERYFSSELPVYLLANYIPPDYTLASYGHPENSNLKTLGFIDISFMVDRNGHTRKLQTLFISPGLEETDYEELLLQEIESSTYRPSFNNGNSKRQNYKIRYYVSALE